MAGKVKMSYRPDHAVPPGQTLQETIDSLGWSQTELAKRLGLAVKTVNEIIHGKAPITHETALLLERVIGGSASFWNNRERLYRERLAQQQEEAQLVQHGEWLKSLPLKELIARGIIQPKNSVAEQVNEALRFFAVGSVETWRSYWMSTPSFASFRSSPSHKRSPEAIATWIRAGQLAGQALDLPTFDKAKFRAAVQVIRRDLCVEKPELAWREMLKLCASAGVALVFVREFPKTCSSGAAFSLPSGNPCILMSGRHGMDDHFWFTFFHEVAHILYHPRKDMFIDSGEQGDSEDAREAQADQVSRDCLIPPEQYALLRRIARISTSTIFSFAARHSLAPGIVVGRLQRDGLLPSSHCNELKHRVNLGAFEQAA